MSEATQAQQTQYVSFRLGRESYALDIWHAREIVDAPPLSQMPNAPAWIPGLMNLRGRIVPVVDLKKKFGLEDAASASVARGYVIIVEIGGEDRPPMSIGLLVDAVLEVFDLPASELEPPPKFGARFSRSYLVGMTKRAAAIVAVMDAAKVLADTDVLLEDQCEPAAGCEASA
jgi:purine-binding chemotaxis protein CheW